MAEGPPSVGSSAATACAKFEQQLYARRSHCTMQRTWCSKRMLNKLRSLSEARQIYFWGCFNCGEQKFESLRDAKDVVRGLQQLWRSEDAPLLDASEWAEGVIDRNRREGRPVFAKEEAAVADETTRANLTSNTTRPEHGSWQGNGKDAEQYQGPDEFEIKGRIFEREEVFSD